ncbi:MAG: glycosyltransferase [Acidimicrobiales bacterium]
MTGAGPNVLVIAAGWPAERRPTRLVHRLLAEGCEVTVAVHGRGGALAHLPVHRLELAAANTLDARSISVVAGAAARAAVSAGDVKAVAARLNGGPGVRSRLQAWHPILPFLGRRWDAVYLPAETGSLPFLPLAATIGPIVATVERPAPLAEVLGAAARVEAASAELAAQAEAAGAAPPNLRVVEPTADPDFFHPAPPLAGPDELAAEPPTPRIVCTASFDWTGGHEYALLAVRQLVDGGTDVQLDLVDDGSDRQRLLYTVADLGLEPIVTIHRHLSRRAILEVLLGARLFLLACVEDRPWPELLEALACGLPVVASDLPSVRRAVTTVVGAEGVDATLVASRDPSALADALATQLGRP